MLSVLFLSSLLVVCINSFGYLRLSGFRNGSSSPINESWAMLTLEVSAEVSVTWVLLVCGWCLEGFEVANEKSVGFLMEV